MYLLGEWEDVGMVGRRGLHACRFRASWNFKDNLRKQREIVMMRATAAAQPKHLYYR